MEDHPVEGHQVEGLCPCDHREEGLAWADLYPLEGGQEEDPWDLHPVLPAEVA